MNIGTSGVLNVGGIDWSGLDGSVLNDAMALGSSATTQAHAMGYGVTQTQTAAINGLNQNFQPQSQNLQQTNFNQNKSTLYQNQNQIGQGLNSNFQSNNLNFWAANLNSNFNLNGVEQQQQNQIDFRSQLEFIRSLEREKQNLEIDVQNKRSRVASLNQQLQYNGSGNGQNDHLNLNQASYEPPVTVGQSFQMQQQSQQSFIIPKPDFRGTMNFNQNQELYNISGFVPKLNANIVKVPPLIGLSDLKESNNQTRSKKVQNQSQQGQQGQGQGRPISPPKLREPSEANNLSEKGFPGLGSTLTAAKRKELPMSIKKREQIALLQSVCPYLAQDIRDEHAAEGKQLFLDLRVANLDKNHRLAEIKRYTEQNENLQKAREECKKSIAEIYKKMAEIDNAREENDDIIRKHQFELETSSSKVEQCNRRLEEIKQAKYRPKKKSDTQVEERINRYTNLVTNKPNIMNSTLETLKSGANNIAIEDVKNPKPPIWMATQSTQNQCHHLNNKPETQSIDSFNKWQNFNNMPPQPRKVDEIIATID